jgi:hypothetical protein
MKATTKRHYELDLMRWEGVVIDKKGNNKTIPSRWQGIVIEEDNDKISCGILRTSRKQALQDAKKMIKELEEK